MPKNPNYTTCESCGRLLRVVDGPICEDCRAKSRSEAARTAADARWAKEREEDQGKETE